MKAFTKQPRDHLDYEIDLSEWLDAEDRIQNVSMTVPDGIEVTHYGFSDHRVVLWVKGGESGQQYSISPLIYTNSRTKEVDLLFVVEDI